MTNIFKWIALLFVGLLIGVGLFVALKGTRPIKALYYAYAYDSNNNHVQLYEADNRLGYRPKPNISYDTIVAGRHIPIYTNSRGARVSSPVENQSSPIDKRSILTVGCSQSFGWGVFNDETFSDIIAKHFNLNSNNFSISGQGTVGSYLSLEKYLDSDTPIIIYSLWENHFERNVIPCVNSGRPFCVVNPFIAMKDKSDLKISLAVDPFDNERLSKIYLDKHQYNAFQADGTWDNYQREQDNLMQQHYHQLTDRDKKAHEVDVMIQLLSLMKKQSDDMNSQFIVVYMPYYDHSGPISKLNHEVKQYLFDNHIDLIDLTQTFETMALNKESIPLFGDGHISEKTHANIANTIIEHIESNQYLIAG